MQSAVEVVRAFQADFLAWNDRSFAASEAGADEATAESEYGELLARYCRPGFVGEPIAFGFPSHHDPAREEVLDTVEDGLTAVVRTRMTRTLGSMSKHSHYEYRLARHDRGWYLEQLFVVVDAEKLPCL